MRAFAPEQELGEAIDLMRPYQGKERPVTVAGRARRVRLRLARSRRSGAAAREGLRVRDHLRARQGGARRRGGLAVGRRGGRLQAVLERRRGADRPRVPRARHRSLRRPGDARQRLEPAHGQGLRRRRRADVLAAPRRREGRARSRRSSSRPIRRCRPRRRRTSPSGTKKPPGDAPDKLDGPVPAFEELAAGKKAAPRDARGVRALPRLTGGDDPPEHVAQDFARRAAEARSPRSRAICSPPSSPRTATRARMARPRAERVGGERARPSSCCLRRPSSRAPAPTGATRSRSTSRCSRSTRQRPRRPRARRALPRGRAQAHRAPHARAALEQQPARRSRCLRVYAASAARLGRDDRGRRGRPRYAALRFDDTDYLERAHRARGRAPRSEGGGALGRAAPRSEPDSAWALSVAARAYRALGPGTAGHRATTSGRSSSRPRTSRRCARSADLYGADGQDATSSSSLLRQILAHPAAGEGRARVRRAHRAAQAARRRGVRLGRRSEFLAAAQAPRRRATTAARCATSRSPPSSRTGSRPASTRSSSSRSPTRRPPRRASTRSPTRPTARRCSCARPRSTATNGKVDEAIESGEGPADNPAHRHVHLGAHVLRALPAAQRRATSSSSATASRTSRSATSFADYFGEVAYLQRPSPSRSAEYVLITPKSRSFYFNTPPLPGLSAHRDGRGRSARLRLQGRRGAAARCPSRRCRPRPRCSAHVHVSTYKTWDEVAAWYWGLAKDQFDARRRGAHARRRDHQGAHRRRRQGARHLRLRRAAHALRRARVRHLRLQAAPLRADVRARLGRLQRQGDAHRDDAEGGSASPPRSCSCAPACAARFETRAREPRALRSRHRLRAVDGPVPRRHRRVHRLERAAGDGSRRARADRRRERQGKLMHLPDPDADATTRVAQDRRDARRPTARRSSTCASRPAARSPPNGASATTPRGRARSASRAISPATSRDSSWRRRARRIEMNDLEDIEQPVKLHARGKAPSFGPARGPGSLASPSAGVAHGARRSRRSRRASRTCALHVRSTLDDELVDAPPSATAKSRTSPSRCSERRPSVPSRSRAEVERRQDLAEDAGLVPEDAHQRRRVSGVASVLRGRRPRVRAAPGRGSAASERALSRMALSEAGSRALLRHRASQSCGGRQARPPSKIGTSRRVADRPSDRATARSWGNGCLPSSSPRGRRSAERARRGRSSSRLPHDGMYASLGDRASTTGRTGSPRAPRTPTSSAVKAARSIDRSRARRSMAWFATNHLLSFAPNATGLWDKAEPRRPETHRSSGHHRVARARRARRDGGRSEAYSTGQERRRRSLGRQARVPTQRAPRRALSVTAPRGDRRRAFEAERPGPGHDVAPPIPGIHVAPHVLEDRAARLPVRAPRRSPTAMFYAETFVDVPGEREVISPCRALTASASTTWWCSSATRGSGACGASSACGVRLAKGRHRILARVGSAETRRFACSRPTGHRSRSRSSDDARPAYGLAPPARCVGRSQRARPIREGRRAAARCTTISRATWRGYLAHVEGAGRRRRGDLRAAGERSEPPPRWRSLAHGRDLRRERSRLSRRAIGTISRATCVTRAVTKDPELWWPRFWLALDQAEKKGLAGRGRRRAQAGRAFPRGARSLGGARAALRPPRLEGRALGGAERRSRKRFPKNQRVLKQLLDVLDEEGRARRSREDRRAHQGARIPTPRSTVDRALARRDWTRRRSPSSNASGSGGPIARTSPIASPTC